MSVLRRGAQAFVEPLRNYAGTGRTQALLQAVQYNTLLPLGTDQL